MKTNHITRAIAAILPLFFLLLVIVPNQVHAYSACTSCRIILRDPTCTAYGAQQPVASLSVVGATTVGAGQPVTLSWNYSSGYTGTITDSNGVVVWSTTDGTAMYSGTLTVYPAVGITGYTYTTTGDGGIPIYNDTTCGSAGVSSATAQSSVSISVVAQPPPVCTASMTPSSLYGNVNNAATTFSWTSLNATSLSFAEDPQLGGYWNGIGSVSPVPGGSNTYNPTTGGYLEGTASGPGGTYTAPTLAQIGAGTPQSACEVGFSYTPSTNGCSGTCILYNPGYYCNNQSSCQIQFASPFADPPTNVPAPVVTVTTPTPLAPGSTAVIHFDIYGLNSGAYITITDGVNPAAYYLAETATEYCANQEGVNGCANWGAGTLYHYVGDYTVGPFNTSADPCIDGICPHIPVAAPTASCSVSPTSGLTTGTYTWTASASGGTGSGYTYSWSGTNLTGKTGSTATVNNYAAGGPYTGAVTVTDSAGNSSGSVPCSNSVTSVSAPATATASLTISPNPVALNGRPTITWTSTNATSCTAGGPWSNASDPLGTSPNPGSGLTNPITGPTTFTFQCTGPGGTSPLQTVTVNVIAVPITGVSCSVLPGSGTATVTGFTWKASGATGGTPPYTYTWSGTGPLNGQVGSTIANLVYPSAGSYNGSVTVTDSASNTSGSVSCSANGGGQPGGVPGPITVTAGPPSCSTFQGASSSIGLGATDPISWSCQNATSCTQVANSDGFATGGAVSGTDNSVTPSNMPTTVYAMQCTGPGGTTTINSQPITVTTPSAYITATPSRVNTTMNTQLSWSAQQVTGCLVTGTDGYNSGPLIVDANHNVATTSPPVQRGPFTTQTTYTMTCTPTIGSLIKVKVIINVSPSFTPF